MKRLFIPLLVLSLGLNAYALFHYARHLASATTPAPDSTLAKTSAEPDIPPFSTDTWALLKSGDASSPAQLKALGFSDAITRALLRAELNKRYRPRIEALRDAPVPYWQRGYFPWNIGRIRDRGAETDLDREKEAGLKRLLGPLYSPDPQRYNRYADASYLPADKAEQLRIIDEDYNAMRSERALFESIRLPEDAERQRYLDQQRRADIVALLSPEELQAFDYHTSSTANNLRYSLAGFNATEEEFKTLYALRKPLEELSASTADAQVRRGAESAVEKQIESTLGEQRYAEYKRSKDFDYRTLTSLTRRLDLPTEKANEGYSLKLALEQKAKTFQPVPGAGEKQQRADFNAALLREAETGFIALYGEKGYAAIRDRIASRLNSPAR